MTEKRKRIIAALVCLGLVTAAAAPAALAERSDTAGRTDAEQRTQIASQTEETRGGRGAGSEDGSARCRPAEAAEPENAIGKAAAKEAALADAGLNADQAERIRARVSDKDGTTVYRVSFVCGGQKYSYRIDPLTGAVLDKTVSEASEEGAHSHGRRERPAEAAEPENAIGKAAAKEAALADAGLNADQAERIRARVSDKDGTTVYRVSFVCGGQKYSYRIDPLTGEVLDKTVSEASERAGHSGHKQHNGTDGSAETQLPTV